jgi:hypothetical protein
MLFAERDHGDGNTAGWRSEAICFSYAVDHDMVKSMADQDEGVDFKYLLPSGLRGMSITRFFTNPRCYCRTRVSNARIIQFGLKLAY